MTHKQQRKFSVQRAGLYCCIIVIVEENVVVNEFSSLLRFFMGERDKKMCVTGLKHG